MAYRDHDVVSCDCISCSWMRDNMLPSLNKSKESKMSEDEKTEWAIWRFPLDTKRQSSQKVLIPEGWRYRSLVGRRGAAVGQHDEVSLYAEVQVKPGVLRREAEFKLVRTGNISPRANIHCLDRDGGHGYLGTVAMPDSAEVFHVYLLRR